jgi:hypothetical protein
MPILLINFVISGDLEILSSVTMPAKINFSILTTFQIQGECRKTVGDNEPKDVSF